MSQFQPPNQRLATLLARFNALEALVRRVITADGQVRLDGSTTVGVLPTHTHAGTGQGGLVDSDSITYTPTVLTDWDGDVDPGDVEQALDQLAERIDDVEGAAGHDASEIIDDDGDTGWRAEAAADEDILRARTGGTQRMVIDSTGNVILGGDETQDSIVINGASAVEARFAVRLDGVSSPLGLLFSQHSSSVPSAVGPFITMAKSRGSLATPLALTADAQLLGVLDFLGHDGTDYLRGAQIRVEVDGTPGSNDMPTRIRILTTPDGSDTAAERFRLNNAGVWVATAGRERWPVTAKTIATDQIAIASGDTGHWTLAGEGGAADDLDGITGGTQGDILILSPVSDSVTITITHNNAGGSSGAKIFTSSGSSITMDDIHDCAIFIYKTALDSGNGGWMQIGGSGGGGASLTVQEEDASPSDTAVTLLKVPNGGLTDNGAGDVSLKRPMIKQQIARWYIDGRLRADASNAQGGSQRVPDYAVAGVLVEGTAIFGGLGVTSAGAAVTFDIKHSTTYEGSRTTIFSSTPSIAAGDVHTGDTSSNDGTIDTSPDYTILDGGFFWLYITQVGSTAGSEGQDLVVEIEANVFAEY